MNKIKISLAILFASTLIFIGCNSNRSRTLQGQDRAAQQATAEEMIAIQNERVAVAFEKEAVIFGVKPSDLDSLKLPEITDSSSKSLVDIRAAKAKAYQVQIAQVINQVLRLKILATGGSLKDENADTFVYVPANNPQAEYIRALQALATEADIQQRLQIHFNFAAKAKGKPWPHPVSLKQALKDIRRIAKKRIHF